MKYRGSELPATGFVRSRRRQSRQPSDGNVSSIELGGLATVEVSTLPRQGEQNIEAELIARLVPP